LNLRSLIFVAAVQAGDKGPDAIGRSCQMLSDPRW
jgi:hypothetical protein